MVTFEEYLRQGEATPGKRAQAWQAAIGLQDVDGLKTSEDLVHLNISYVQEPKSNKCTLDCTLEEMALLDFLKATSRATQKQMAGYLDCSERKVKAMTVSLQQRNLLVRQNGRREGWWEVKSM